MTTTKQLRRKIRAELGVSVFGRLPLRSREISKAYEQITGEKPGEEWSAAKTRHVALSKASSSVDREDDFDREPYDAQQPYRKQELQIMYDALEKASDDSTDDEATAEAGGDRGA